MKTEATFVLMPHLTFGLPDGLALSGHLEVVVIHECTWPFIEFRTLRQVLATPKQVRRGELPVYEENRYVKKIIIEQPVRFKCHGNLDVTHFAELAGRRQSGCVFPNFLRK